jgi:hypothetical protein
MDCDSFVTRFVLLILVQVIDGDLKPIAIVTITTSTYPWTRRNVLQLNDNDNDDQPESPTTPKPAHFKVTLPSLNASTTRYRQVHTDSSYQHSIHIITTIPNHCFPTPSPYPTPLQFLKPETSPVVAAPSMNPTTPSPSSNDAAKAKEEYVGSVYERAMVGDWRVSLKAVVCSAGSSSGHGLKLNSMRRLSTASLVYGPYLQSVGPTSALVVWRQDVSAIGVVHVGLAYGTYTMQFSSIKSFQLILVVELTGLKINDNLLLHNLNTRWVDSEGKQTQFHDARQYWKFGKPLRMAFLGDPGTGDIYQVNVRDAMRKYGKTIKARTMVFALGDNAYDYGTDNEYQEKFFKVYQEDMKNVAMYAVIGNHDSSSTLSSSGKESGPYFDRFITPKAGESGGVPSGSGLYYSIDYGTWCTLYVLIPFSVACQQLRR